MPTFDEAAAWVRGAELGRAVPVPTPFGERRLLYADLTASGRALSFVEAAVARLLPWYANVHSAQSTTGRAMTLAREDARRAVARAVNAGPDDVVLFVGSGATAAVNKLVGLLGLRIPEPLEREHHLSRAIPRDQRPVVLAGPSEHHSHELPWLESIAELVEVELTPDGAIDLEDLRRKAHAHRHRPLRIGAISAASNVTGVLTDVRAVCRVLHEEGAVACIDYAAAGPYVPIDLHPADPLERIDAIFLSVHKFMGGPGASGVLVADRGLFRSRTPERPGGGTVDYVGPAAADRGACCGPAATDRCEGGHEGAPLRVDYVQRLAEREEGGTPNILGDVRAGLAFAVKERLGPERILEHELALAARALERLARHPRLRLLGPVRGPRLPIVSFNVEGLHHELVAALLDHLFGLQVRGGCSCAGPYGHRLLGIDSTTSNRFECAILAGMEGVKPGWVRVNFNYFISEPVFSFVLDAIHFVANHGYKLLPLYRFDLATGEWRPRRTRPRPAMRLSDLSYRSGKLEYRTQHSTEPEWALSGYLEEAARIVAEAERDYRAMDPLGDDALPEDAEALRWFPLPEEVLCEMLGREPPTRCALRIDATT